VYPDGSNAIGTMLSANYDSELTALTGRKQSTLTETDRALSAVHAVETSRTYRATMASCSW
jgi:hypothetical protein